MARVAAADHKVCQGLTVPEVGHLGAESYTDCASSEVVEVELYYVVLTGSAEVVEIDMAGLVPDQGVGSWDEMLCVGEAVVEVVGVEYSAVKTLNLTEIRHSWLPLREKEYLVVFLGSSPGSRSLCNIALEKSQSEGLICMICATYFSSRRKTTVRCLTSR